MGGGKKIVSYNFSNGGGCPKIEISDVPTSELTIFLASPLINLQFRNGGGGAVCENLWKNTGGGEEYQKLP